jgi:hypothetical protein
MPYAAPKVRCQDRSGYPCSTVVALDSPNCGDPSHFPGANGGQPFEKREPGCEAPDLDVLTFDPQRVHVTRSALNDWGRRPAALQAKMQQALIRGGYWRCADGTHLLEMGRHQMVLSSDGLRCESYAQLAEPPPHMGRADRSCCAHVEQG